jgi:DNA polymerase I-like protein with 3'-5' exonuclease and polymerase domains
MFWTRTALGRNRVYTEPPIPDTGWKCVDEYPSLASAKVISIDCETCDPDLKTKGPGTHRGAYIAGVSVATDTGFCRYYPVDHTKGMCLNPDKVLRWLRKELARPKQLKIGANILYDLEHLDAAGVPIVGRVLDVQHMGALLDPERQHFSLEALSQDTLGRGKKEDVLGPWLEAAFGKAAAKSNIHNAPPELVGPYAEEDARLPLDLYASFMPRIQEAGLEPILQLECDLIPMLLAMRKRGVPVDVPGAEVLRDRMRDQEQTALGDLRREVGKDVDVWSAESLAGAMDKLGIPYPRTDKDRPSFTRAWLEHHPARGPQLVAAVRHAQRLRTTFLEGYILGQHVNGHLYGQFHQLRSDENGTVTGRFSSSTPNLQNIPRRTSDGNLIRSVFVPEKGRIWLKSDWSQIEYRLIVHFAELAKYPKARTAADLYRKDRRTDFHAAIQKLVGELSRDECKTLNFGLAYGQGLQTLCNNLGVDQVTGEQIINRYFAEAPFVKKLFDACSTEARQKRCVRTLLDRRQTFSRTEIRYGREIPANTHKALNSKIQGSAADIMKTAMLQIWESGVCDVLGAPFLTVHDELDLDFDPGNKVHAAAVKELTNIMENAVKLRVPLLVDSKTGSSWGQCV